MIVCKTVSEVRRWRAQQQGRVGIVPTMGYLHEGHLSLVRAIRPHCDVIVATIFVNPTQFTQAEDLEKYPRNEVRDCALLSSEGVEVVFVPAIEEIYPPGCPPTWVSVEGVSEPMEGTYRPGHFRGVTTVVTKLFSIVQPDVSIFGEKDFQQLRVIEEMTKALLLPTTIVRGALIREEDGLAMSSRNVRLSPEDRISARALSRALRAARILFDSGVCDTAVLRAEIERVMSEVAGIKIDYIELVDEETLRPAPWVKPGTRICIAAWIGGVRLIDTDVLGGRVFRDSHPTQNVTE